MLGLNRNKTFDGRKIHLLENLLLTWKNQIQTAIQYDREPSKSNASLFPNTEMEFWIKRTENLRGIQTQVMPSLFSWIESDYSVASFTINPTIGGNSRSIDFELFRDFSCCFSRCYSSTG